MDDDYGALLATAVAVAEAAGELLRREFLREGGPVGHAGHAPIDQAAEEMIRVRLLEASPPAWGYLGEETSPERIARREETSV